jgi:hypothetical protein
MATVTTVCRGGSFAFTTGDVGAPVDPTSLVGRTYALDLTAALWRRPDGLGDLFASYVEPRLLRRRELARSLGDVQGNRVRSPTELIARVGATLLQLLRELVDDSDRVDGHPKHFQTLEVEPHRAHSHLPRLPIHATDQILSAAVTGRSTDTGTGTGTPAASLGGAWGLRPTGS